MYKINGTTLSLQPTTGRWVDRELLGNDGSGHPIYSARREFELRWDLISAADANQLQGFYNTVTTTGTAVVDLPNHRYTSYEFLAYSGCVLYEPITDIYFNEHETSVVMRIGNIRTE